jgi:hypothetical protein
MVPAAPPTACNASLRARLQALDEGRCAHLELKTSEPSKPASTDALVRASSHRLCKPDRMAPAIWIFGDMSLDTKPIGLE